MVKRRETMENENKYSKISKLEVIEKFCKHLRDGFSKDCFVDFDFTEVHRMAEETDKGNNNTDCMEMIERAYREYKYYWEKHGIENMYTEVRKGNNTVKKFNRNIWMFMFKLNREKDAGQAEIPFEGMNLIRLKSNS
jgi:hypothetical protein